MAAVKQAAPMFTVRSSILRAAGSMPVPTLNHVLQSNESFDVLGLEDLHTPQEAIRQVAPNASHTKLTYG